MERRTAADFPPEVLALFDEHVHGGLDRRGFLDRASRLAAGSMAAATAWLESLSPNYAWAQQVAPDDARLRTARASYDSPKGHGTMRGYLVRPVEPAGRLPGVLVVHENRGLTPYIEDVTRRLGLAGFLAFAPDALTPLGGYPGDDDKGRQMQATLDRARILEDFVAAAEWLKAHPEGTGRVGVVGFCFGGLVANMLAVRLPDLAAAVPFYGGQPPAEDVPRIKARLLIHYAGNDERVNAGWPAYEAALKAHGIPYTVHVYEGTQHGFHNDSTPRYDESAARLAWQRTIDFFNATLR